MSNLDSSLPSERIKIIAIMGSDQDMSTAIPTIGKQLSSDFGGVFISQGQGYWSSIGNKVTDHYPSDTILEEQSLKIELLILPSQKELALKKLRDAISNANNKHKLDCRFIHVEISESLAAHIDLD